MRVEKDGEGERRRRGRGERGRKRRGEGGEKGRRRRRGRKVCGLKWRPVFRATPEDTSRKGHGHRARCRERLRGDVQKEAGRCCGPGRGGAGEGKGDEYFVSVSQSLFV